MSGLSNGEPVFPEDNSGEPAGLGSNTVGQFNGALDGLGETNTGMPIDPTDRNIDIMTRALGGMGLDDGEIITRAHVGPIVAALIDVYGIEGGTAGMNEVVGQTWVTPERHQRNVDYLDSFGPRIPFKKTGED